MNEIPDLAEPDLSSVAFVLMCDPCAQTYPEGPPPRLDDVFGPRGWHGELRCGVVPAILVSDLKAAGFEIVDPDPDPALGLDLYCPHCKWDAALDEWRTAQ
jgi:hypothetical protein